MKRTKNRDLALIPVLITASVLLTSCGASGQNAPTRMIKQVTDGVEKDVGSLLARNVLLVAQPDGSAVLVGTFINEGTDQDAITGIKVNGAAMKLDKAPYELLQNQPITFSGDTANAKGSIDGLNLTPGNRVSMEVSYANAGVIKLDVLVLAKDGVYQNVSQ